MLFHSLGGRRWRVGGGEEPIRSLEMLVPSPPQSAEGCSVDALSLIELGHRYKSLFRIGRIPLGSPPNIDFRPQDPFPSTSSPWLPNTQKHTAEQNKKNTYV